MWPLECSLSLSLSLSLFLPRIRSEHPIHHLPDQMAQYDTVVASSTPLLLTYLPLHPPPPPDPDPLSAHMEVRPGLAPLPDSLVSHVRRIPRTIITKCWVSESPLEDISETTMDCPSFFERACIVLRFPLRFLL